MLKPVAFITLSLLIFSVACDIEIQPELKVSDIIETCNGKGETALTTNAVIRFEISGKETFEENKDQITEILGNYFTDIKHVRLENADFKSYYAADAKFPIYAAAKEPENKDSMIFISADKKDDVYRISLNIGNGFISHLNRNIPDSFMQKYSIRDLSFDFKLSNDTKQKITTKVHSSYIDGKASPFTSETAIDARDSVSIKVSEVFRDFIEAEGSGVFVEFKAPKEEKKEEKK